MGKQGLEPMQRKVPNTRFIKLILGSSDDESYRLSPEKVVVVNELTSQSCFNSKYTDEEFSSFHQVYKSIDNRMATKTDNNQGSKVNLD
jgi:hypothetical protein